MLLAIDSGNTNVVFAIYDGDDRRGEWRSATNANRTADEYAVWLSQLMGLSGLTRDDIDAAIIASVVPKADHPLRSLCRQYFSCEPVLIGAPGVDLGIRVLVDNPAEVGADRLVNTVGARTRFPGPLIIIDFGTATTFDVVDGDGNYFGGVIAPGINLSLEALDAAAAKLPRVAIERPAKVIGRGTVSAMQSGIFWGYVGLIEGLVERIRDEFGAEMTVIATGGLAPLFADATPAIEHLDSDLTLRGLLAIHRRNAGP
ncbi:MAG: type III pantothenate kinase [Alphaproteobacteria bacterium]|nr:type III pantothenate kinase [Alphaproteobacteria bacterium]